MKRLLALIGAYILALTCTLTLSPAHADGERPDREEYAAALDATYRPNLMDMGADDSAIDTFGTCIVEATYTQMTPEALTAITHDDLDYELAEADATIFLDATETCLDSAGLSQLAADADGDTQATSESDTSSLSETGGGPQEDLDATAQALQSDEPANTDTSPSWRFPLITSLSVVLILALSGYLVLTNRAKAAHRRTALDKSETSTISDILS